MQPKMFSPQQTRWRFPRWRAVFRCAGLTVAGGSRGDCFVRATAATAPEAQQVGFFGDFDLVKMLT